MSAAEAWRAELQQQCSALAAVPSVRDEQHRGAYRLPRQSIQDDEAWWAAQLAEEPAAGAATPADPLPGLDLARLAEAPPLLQWLVEGRMTEATFTVLGAKPGVGKSWLGEDLAVALASGRAWLGHRVPRPRRVLYLDAENGEDLVLRRLRQLGARPDELGGRLLYSVEPLLLSRGPDLARLAATVERHQPELLVVDTLASHAPAAESDTEHMAGFLADVWTVARRSRCALLLLHHLRKGLQGSGKDDPLDAFRGSGHLIGAADRAWVLDQLAPGEPRFILRDVKPRQFPCAPPTRITVVDDEDSPADDRRTRLEVQGIEPVVERGYDAFLHAALALIDAHEGRPVLTKDLVHLGMTLPGEFSERSCKQWLTRGLQTGVLHKPARGQWLRAQTPLDQPDDDEEAA
ncbi:MAG: helicase RepA family protein [Actinomycetota bacterium]|nr:helicase RepA family protein [Actinomycetota bacterium]